ncbi:hypothetical protein E4U56_006270 [Claviceps arundinis]|uniref:Uncharacterized protein n=1 Tax=Claviceps arundinis TaxID=1623583 RepID=A0A9P7MZJ0_9HYPO|nr:hypothetical protein E4U56_006270 [Claviceps arundinis]
MSMMSSSTFSATINRAAVLNNRGSSSIRGRASRRHGLDISRHDLEDGRFHAQVSSTDSLESILAELERVDHHSENGTRSPRGLCRLFNFRRRHTEFMGHRDVAFSPFDQSVLGSRLASGTRRLLRRILRFVSSENQWLSVEDRVATPCASENGDDDEDFECEPPEGSGQNRRSDERSPLESSSSSVFEAYPLLHCSVSVTLRRMV